MDKKSRVIETSAIFKGLRFAIILSLLISAILILMTLDTDSIKKILESVKPEILLLIVIIMLINWSAAGLRFKIMVSTVGHRITFREGIIIFLTGSFISNVTPFATGGGPFQVYLLHKKGINIGKATMVILTQYLMRVFFFITANTIFLVFFKWAISPGIVPSYVFYMAYGAGFLFAFAVIVFTIVPGIVEKLLSLFLRIKKIKQFVENSYKTRKLIVRIRKEVNEFHRSLELLQHHKRKLVLAILVTLVYWTALFMILPLILIGLGYEPGFFKSYVMQTIFNLVIPFIPTPGASGIAELGFASIFVSYIPKGIIGLVTFAWRFITFYFILIVGGFFALREIGWKRHKKNE
ncbi:MAG: lysylphosphatidylglycerol synthase transmembrane domain-containing protein [Halothermotrichaceae bacterium]